MTVKWITKKNGDLQKFSKAKIIAGCKKSGCSLIEAQWVADAVVKKSYDKISSRKIGNMVVANLKRINKRAATHFNRVFTRNWRGI